MHAVVVYESMFGNTQAIAKEVATSLSAHLPTRLYEVSQAPHELTDDVALLVVGAPSHTLGLSTVSTRLDATDRAAERGQHVVSEQAGLGEWIGRLSVTSAVTAVFDTHLGVPTPGSAERAASHRLRRAGFVVHDHARFQVHGMRGPLAHGELDRARAWGEHLGERFDVPATSTTGTATHRPEAVPDPDQGP